MQSAAVATTTTTTATLDGNNNNNNINYYYYYRKTKSGPADSVTIIPSLSIYLAGPLAGWLTG